MAKQVNRGGGVNLNAGPRGGGACPTSSSARPQEDGDDCLPVLVGRGAAISGSDEEASLHQLERDHGISFEDDVFEETSFKVHRADPMVASSSFATESDELAKSPKEPQYNVFGDLIDRDENRWLRRWHLQQCKGHGGDDSFLNPRGKNAARNAAGDLVDREEYRRLRQWHLAKQSPSANHVVLTKAEEWKRGGGVLLRVCIIVALALPVWFSANAFLPEIKAEFGLDDKQASLLTVAVNIGFVCATTLSTLMRVADRSTASRLVATGTLLCGLFSAVLVIGLPFDVNLIARFLAGAAIALIYPVLVKYLSTWFSALRGFAMGCLIGSFTLGAAVPSLVKAILPFAPWRAGILVPTGLAVIGSVLASRLAQAPGTSGTAAAAFSCKTLLRVVRDRRWLLVTISYMGHSFELYGGWAWMGAFLREYFDGEDEPGGSLAPLAAFVVVATGSFGCVAAGALADRFGRILVISVSHAVSGICIASLPFLSTTAPQWLVLAVACLWGLTVNADSAQYSAMITEVISDAQLVSTAVTVSIAFGFVMTAIAIYVVPALVYDFEWKGAFLALSAGPAIGICAIQGARTKGSKAPPRQASRLLP